MGHEFSETICTEILHLLQERNRCLIKFSVLNKAELKKFGEKNYDGVDSFYHNREGLLAMVSKIELLISRKIEELGGEESFVSEQFKKTMNEILKMKDTVVKEILDLDLEILSTLDQEKAKIFNEMQAINKGRKVISAYKSEKSKSNLNEEA